MITENSIQGAYGEVCVSVQVRDMPKGSTATREDVKKLLRVAMTESHDSLEMFYAMHTSDGVTRTYSEPHGFKYEGVTVEVECVAHLHGVPLLKTARSYVGLVTEYVTSALAEYLGGSYESLLAEPKQSMFASA